MLSVLLGKLHVWSVMLFVLIYLVKTVLLFTNTKMLDTFAARTKVIEMIVSTVFLVTGIWLFVILGGIKTFQILKLVLVFVSIPLAIVGFKRRIKGVALLAFLLIVASYGVAEMSKNKPFLKANVVINGTGGGRLENGERVYFENCVFCHGTDGKKMYRGAKDLSMTGFDETSIQAMVHDGVKGKMPAYGASLSYEEIADVALYVASMKNTDTTNTP